MLVLHDNLDIVQKKKYLYMKLLKVICSPPSKLLCPPILLNRHIAQKFAHLVDYFGYRKWAPQLLKVGNLDQNFSIFQPWEGNLCKHLMNG